MYSPFLFLRETPPTKPPRPLYSLFVQHSISTSARQVGQYNFYYGKLFFRVAAASLGLQNQRNACKTSFFNKQTPRAALVYFRE
jgi:hypothetical protein